MTITRMTHEFLKLQLELAAGIGIGAQWAREMLKTGYFLEMHTSDLI